METARERGELLCAVLLPGPTKHSGSAYRKWGLSTATLPVVGIGVRLSVDDQGTCKTARVAVGGLANGSQRLIAAEDGLPGLSESSGDKIAALFFAASQTVEVQSDSWATAEYRDFLSRNEDPTDEEIRYALVGNLCRCTGYSHIVEAVRNAARAMKAAKGAQL